MERRDLIQDEIERLGRVLGKILATFLGLKSQGKVQEGIEEAEQQLQSYLDLDVPKLLQLEGRDLVDYLQSLRLTRAKTACILKLLHSQHYRTKESLLEDI